MEQELPLSFPWKIGCTRRYFATLTVISVLYFALFGAIIAWNAIDMQNRGQDPLLTSVLVSAGIFGTWFIALVCALGPRHKPFSISFGRDAIEARSVFGSQKYPAAGSILDIRVEERIIYIEAEGGRRPGIIRPVVISFIDQKPWAIPESTVGAFGQSPESLASALRRLYRGYMATGSQEKANELIAMANQWLEKDGLDEAIAAFEQAIRLYPPYISYKLTIGDQLFESERFSEAALAYRQLVSAIPEHGQAWCGLGRCLVMTGEYAEALHAFDRSLELNPDDALIWYNRAVAYAVMKDTVKAKADLQKAFSLRPDLEAVAREVPLFTGLFE